MFVYLEKLKVMFMCHCCWNATACTLYHCIFGNCVTTVPCVSSARFPWFCQAFPPFRGTIPCRRSASSANVFPPFRAALPRLSRMCFRHWPMTWWIWNRTSFNNYVTALGCCDFCFVFSKVVRLSRRTFSMKSFRMFRERLSVVPWRLSVCSANAFRESGTHSLSNTK